MALTPTPEQSDARDVFATGRDLALVAGAGTGKTATLVLMAATTRQRGLYVAFNKAIADEADTRFGGNVRCRTAHSLAYQAVGSRYQERLRSQTHLPASQTARKLGITRDLRVGTHLVKINHQARLVMGMIRRFCYSIDKHVMARHLEPVTGLDGDGQDYLARTLLPYATRAWEDIRSDRGTLRFEHDHYLKMWALTNPVLPGDFIMLDEAQDTNPVLEEIFLKQSAQRICVGDPAQQIYGWRDARDVMTGFPAKTLHLTESFRFGPRIAEEANRWLRHAESPLKLTGRGPRESRIGAVSNPDVVLCRGNADAMQEVMAYLDQGVSVALTGGGDTIRRVASAAEELKAGRRTSHPELFLFTSWGEVQDYVENDKAGQDLKSIVKLVDKYGPEEVLRAVDRLSAEGDAKVVVSTAHKAKGREWATVRIGPGFDAPSVDDDGLQRGINTAEARLIYVAVTRARLVLDLEGVSWINEYEKGSATRTTPLAALSLTGQLRRPDSPIARFMADHLPTTADLLRDYHKHLATLPHPVQPIDVRYPDWSGIGHTIDYRLRLSFGGHLGPAVSLGVNLLAGTDQLRGAPPASSRRALSVVGEELLATIDAHLTGSTAQDSNTLTRLCYVAASFEDIYRTGQVRRYSMLSGRDARTTLAELVASVPPYVVEDVRAQLALADQPLAGLRALPPSTKVCGPVFAGSDDVPADADYILGGLLLDCKSTKDPHRLGRDELHQLAGYLLLDYDNHYAIDRVGLYLSRQGGLIVWSVEDFLTKLGARAPLALLRARLRTHLRQELRAQGPRQ
ncbi:UvrD-like helicase family protein [Saccharothrix variisporea]|uniref:UvrD-like helicase family protein n=2 Tax=Saccharothrix variisporea TaxID=543527 RepID=A0A495XNG4_9PSEU|nr:UvrD-like helicase family protein [Saccharothrix variisporea]